VSAGECRGVPGSAGECRGVPGSAGKCRGVPVSSGEAIVDKGFLVSADSVATLALCP
jgi:hypothetical protein